MKLSDEAAVGSDSQYGDKTKESGDYSDHDYGCFSGRAFSVRGDRFEADSYIIRRYCCFYLASGETFRSWVCAGSTD